MKRIFSNLDKFYLKNIDTTIAYAGFKIFKDICFIPHTPRIVDLILKYLNQDREGEDIPRSLIKSCLNVRNQCSLNHSTFFKLELQRKSKSK
jgi:hypothetical protein